MTPEIEQRHKDLEITIQKLSNGHRGDPIAMSEGIVNISKTLQVMLKTPNVTMSECILHKARMIEIIDNMVQKIEEKSSTNKTNWKTLLAVLMVCSTLFGLGIHLINTVWPSAADIIIQASHL